MITNGNDSMIMPVSPMYGGGNGCFGGFGGGNGAGFLSNQIDNNAGRELLMNAINSNGDASRAAIQNLATMLGQDYNQVSAAVAALQSGLSNLGLRRPQGEAR